MSEALGTKGPALPPPEGAGLGLGELLEKLGWVRA